MRKNEIRQPSQELEVAVAAKQMHLRVNGSSTYVSMPFTVSEPELEVHTQNYFDLDKLARRQGDKETDYRTHEAALRRGLGNILFAQQPDVPRDRQLAVVLDACLGALREDEYMRLLLSFDEPCLDNLPWELASWTHRGREICLGRDRRIALSRLEQGRAGIRRRNSFGQDAILSILHVGTDAPKPDQAAAADAEKTEYELTRDFFRLVDEHIPRLHTTSRSSMELEQYWIDSAEIMGHPPEMDIVHWDSHGGIEVRGRTPSGHETSISAAELFERTQNAFLYVVRACDAAGAMGSQNCRDRQGKPPSFSAALLEAGAPAVLGTHDAVAPKELAYLPILYPLLFHGWPLDYCVQYMRRFFARKNADNPEEPYDRWYKLILRTTSVWYLDAAPFITSCTPGRNPVLIAAALCRHFDRIYVRRGSERSALKESFTVTGVRNVGQAAAKPEPAAAETERAAGLDDGFPASDAFELKDVLQSGEDLSGRFPVNGALGSLMTHSVKMIAMETRNQKVQENRMVTVAVEDLIEQVNGGTDASEVVPRSEVDAVVKQLFDAARLD